MTPRVRACLAPALPLLGEVYGLAFAGFPSGSQLPNGLLRLHSGVLGVLASDLVDLRDRNTLVCQTFGYLCWLSVRVGRYEITDSLRLLLSPCVIPSVCGSRSAISLIVSERSSILCNQIVTTRKATTKGKV